ncbi:phytoene/squalene synthase family protein [Spirochaeta dissipatitropha]
MNDSNKASLSERQEAIFKRGSKTYYNTSRFFPESVKGDVFCLYSFVRVADDLVDNIPQQKQEFEDFCNKYRKAAYENIPADDDIIDPFIELSTKLKFDPSWTEAFLQSMSWDLSRYLYRTEKEMLEYIYGSAEVIGLYMCRILGLPEEALEPAVYQGRAMQLINFVRDVSEDNKLGRRYLPSEESSLTDLNEETALAHADEFRRYMRWQIDRYKTWQSKAEQGFKLIPYRYRIPVAAAAAMYNWTADQIHQDPFIVYRKKVKPGKIRILACLISIAVQNLLTRK